MQMSAKRGIGNSRTNSSTPSSHKKCFILLLVTLFHSTKTICLAAYAISFLDKILCYAMPEITTWGIAKKKKKERRRKYITHVQWCPTAG